MRMEREQLKSEKIHNADTVSLLPARERTLRAKYERMWRYASEGGKKDFDFVSPEGDSTDAERIEALRHNNRQHELLLGNLYASMKPVAIACRTKA